LDHTDSPASLSQLPRGKVIGTLIGILLALLMSALDQTIVGTAMPRIVGELHGFEHYAWVSTAYLLASTSTVPIAGRLSDIFGRKPLFIIGVLASTLCGAAQTMLQLAAFRGLQGIGAGLLMSMVFASAGDLFPPAKRGRVQGLFSSTFGLASISGPVLGGYITDTWSWRWVFYVNVPVGILVIAAILTLYPHIRPQQRRHTIDFAGAALLVLSVVPILLALSWGGRDYAWSSPQILGLFAFGAAMTALFIWNERRAPDPIIPFDLFANPIVRIALLAVMFVTVGMFGTILFMPLFVQSVLGTSATASGGTLAPMMVGMMICSTLSGQIVSRTGRYKASVVTGLGLMTFAMVLLSLLGPQSTNFEVGRDLLLLGMGMGTAMPILTLAVQNAVPFQRLGVVTSLSQFFRSIGGTIGVAIFGSILTNRYVQSFQASLSPEVRQAVPATVLDGFSNPQALMNPEQGEVIRRAFAQAGPDGARLLAELQEIVRQALASSVHEVFVFGSLVAAIAWVLVWFIEEIPLRRSNAHGRSSEQERGREAMPAGGH
jgi:EmrB/QacA subfamily drug resistance transporter